MDFIEIMKKRHSCRKYISGKTVDRKDLEKIVEAGKLTPSACNSQPWKFIVVDSDEAKEKMCDTLVLKDGTHASGFRHDVSAFIMLVEMHANVMKLVEDFYKDSQHFAQGDIGMAAMNMTYCAMDLGLDTCMLGICDQDKARMHFNIPDGHIVRLIIAIGYGDEGGKIPEKSRKPVEEICSYNGW